MKSPYVVEETHAELRKLIATRRGAQRSTPHPWDEYVRIKQRMFAEYGLESYSDCVMGEMRMRPIPHMFEASKVEALRSLYERRAPALFDRMMREITPPTQAINKLSKLGWPWLRHYESKKQILLPALQRFYETSAEESFGEGWIQVGIRLQPEELEKERIIMVVTDEGAIEERKITSKERALTVNDTPMFGARTRVIESPPSVGNQACQPLDTAIHNWFIDNHGGFSHDLNTPGGVRIPHGFVLMLDMKNFDRFTGPCWRARADIIGGRYLDVVSVFKNLPFLVPSESWKKVFFIWPDYGSGYELQFGSGISAVAPIQKEIFFCIYQEFAETALGVGSSSSANWVLAGGDARFGFLNYGDDNAVFGDKAAVLEFQHFISKYLEAVPEEPPKFLGFLWKDGAFKLGTSSYLLKTWLNERAPFTHFRKYPMHGWVEKRRTYLQKGVPEFDRLFALEDSLLAESSMTWQDVMSRAQVEASTMARSFRSTRVRSLLAEEKEYQLTAEEKLSLPGYEGFYPEETKVMISNIVAPKWREVMK